MNGKPETTAPVKASRRRNGGNHGEYDAAWNFISAKETERNANIVKEFMKKHPAGEKQERLRQPPMRKRDKKDRKIEPWRIIVGTISIVFILFLWVKNDIASTFTTMPKEQAIPLVVTTVVVSAVKVAVITGVILLIKWIIRKIKSK